MSSFNDHVGDGMSSLEPDRLKMSPPTSDVIEPEEIVKSLFDALSSACSKGKFRDYMDCFTPRRASVIKRSVEDFFIRGDTQMEFLDHFVISSGDEAIEVGVRYMISESSTRSSRIVCSKVFVKKVDDSWKIDSE
jgi:hypothetical protein